MLSNRGEGTEGAAGEGRSGAGGEERPGMMRKGSR